MDIKKPLQEKNTCCKARTVLWYLVFFGFGVNYMIRINLNIAIVSMVKPIPKNNVSLTSECIEQYKLELNESRFSENTTSTPLPSFLVTEGSINSTPNGLLKLGIKNYNKKIEENEGFEWNEKQQGLVLGSFFWLHWATQVPGGVLATKFGTKLVFGLSNFIGVIFCFLIPFAASCGYTQLIICRLLQGIILGAAWPSMHNMTARWIPPNERSKFVTAYLGSSVGAALTYPMCGLIIDRWGWELVFYVCGVLGTVWFAAWWLLVYDSPTQHPRISEDEKEYITSSLGQSIAKHQAPVPWKHILTSVPVWMNMLAQFGSVWGLFTLMTHAPTYFKFIHGWNIRATGFLSGMPHLVRMLWAYIFSQLGDYLLRSNKMSRTNVRKLATGFSCIGQGIFMLGLAFSGCNYNAAIIFLTAAVAIQGSVSTGALASVVDISPNYASVLMGLVNTTAAIVGFLTPAVVGSLTFQNQTSHQWQIVFWIATFMVSMSGTTYAIFSRSELAEWNSPDKMNGLESEMFVIKKDGKDISNIRNSYEKVKCTAEDERNSKE